MTLGFSTTFPWGGETSFAEKILSGEKVHTIRADEKGRWRQGRAIQMVTGNRTKQRNEFAKNVCDGVQKIIIVFGERGKISRVTIGENEFMHFGTVAKNDGLSAADFEKWFYNNSKGGIYSGYIIHWTKLRY